MTHEEILRERVAKLEVQMNHLSAKLGDKHQKVEEMHSILCKRRARDGQLLGLPHRWACIRLIAKLTPWSGAWLR